MSHVHTERSNLVVKTSAVEARQMKEFDVEQKHYQPICTLKEQYLHDNRAWNQSASFRLTQ